jgi:hypothetical protein
MGHRHHRLRERWRGASIATVRRCDGSPAGPAPCGFYSRDPDPLPPLGASLPSALCGALTERGDERRLKPLRHQGALNAQFFRTNRATAAGDFEQCHQCDPEQGARSDHARNPPGPGTVQAAFGTRLAPPRLRLPDPSNSLASRSSNRRGHRFAREDSYRGRSTTNRLGIGPANRAARRLRFAAPGCHALQSRFQTTLRAGDHIARVIAGEWQRGGRIPEGKIIRVRRER